MASYKPGIATVPPPTLEKQLEVLAAARLLATQDEELLRRRREEIATLRRAAGELALRFEELRHGYGALVELVQDERRRRDPRLRSHAIKYNADQPRVPAGEHGGGQWTSGGGAFADDASSAPAAAALPASQRGPQYAQASTGTVTDAMNGGGNAPAAAATQQYPKGLFPELTTVIDAFVRDKFVRDRDKIWSYQISVNSPKHPVPLVDSFGERIVDDQDGWLVRPADLPPETYVQAGLAAKSRDLADRMHDLAEAIRGNPDVWQDCVSRVALAMEVVGSELLPFVHGGSFDAERFDNNYVYDYRHYTSIALGIFMAAAGVSRDDALTVADYYAGIFSRFHEEMDPHYTHSTKQDIQDNLKGYELYESGRIRPTR